MVSLEKLDLIECFEYPGKTLQVGEILQKQKDIYRFMGVEPPSSLWVNGNVGCI